MEDNLIIEEELKKQLWKVPVDIDLIENGDISHAGFRLYCMLMGYARQDTTCFPSIKTLACKMHCQSSYIHTLKTELQDLGLLTVERWKIA